MLERKQLSLEQAWPAMKVSRATLYNWLKRDAPPPSKKHREKLVQFFGQPADFVLYGQVQQSKTSPVAGLVEEPPDYVKTRGILDRGPSELSLRVPPMLNPQHAIKQPPSDQAECEAYFSELMRRAAASAKRNAFPVIMDRLEKYFPLDEWDEAK